MTVFGRRTDIEQTPFLESVLSDQVRKEYEQGRLPVIETDRIYLDPGEKCRYVERALYEKKIKVPRAVRQKKQSGLFRSRAAEEQDAQKSTIVDITFEQHDGYLFITDRRVIFQGSEEEWDQSLTSLLSIKPYLNCVKLQFGKDAYKVFVPDGNIAHIALMLVRPPA